MPSMVAILGWISALLTLFPSSSFESFLSYISEDLFKKMPSLTQYRTGRKNRENLKKSPKLRQLFPARH